MIADKIERGILVFPETGCELLISQLTGFGIEKHDDLVDALTVAVIEIMNQAETGGTVYIGTHDLWNGGGIYTTKSKPRGAGRDYWNRRLDDFNEATSGDWEERNYSSVAISSVVLNSLS